MGPCDSAVLHSLPPALPSQAVQPLQLPPAGPTVCLRGGCWAVPVLRQACVAAGAGASSLPGLLRNTTPGGAAGMAAVTAKAAGRQQQQWQQQYGCQHDILALHAHGVARGQCCSTQLGRLRSPFMPLDGRNTLLCCHCNAAADIAGRSA